MSACAAAVAVAAAGCTHVKVTSSHKSAAPPQSAVQQVVTTCYKNLYYTGLLPESAAKVNCRYCVADELEKLGVEPTPHETQAALISGAILSSTNMQTLQDACNQNDNVN